MTAKELAALLNGGSYGSELSAEQKEMARENKLVVVFGYSDDCVEFVGGFNDEVGAFDGVTVHVTRKGVLERPEYGCDDCEFFRLAKKAAVPIKAVWHDAGEPCWTFETDIPHETFRIYEDGELFCIGIVFCLEDLPD